MTDETVLFDSNIIIDALNGVEAGRQELRASNDPAISIVSWIEVLAGCPSPEAEVRARALLSSIAILPLTEDVAEPAVTIRRATRLKLPDAIILATARVHGLTLSTRNTRDFRPDFPEVRIPYQL
jgi:predicted nucleic acid-binding protein